MSHEAVGNNLHDALDGKNDEKDIFDFFLFKQNEKMCDEKKPGSLTIKDVLSIEKSLRTSGEEPSGGEARGNGYCHSPNG